MSDGWPQTGLLAGIVMAMVIMGAAVLTSVYMYNHPTSSASLFFMEVSDLFIHLLETFFHIELGLIATVNICCLKKQQSWFLYSLI